MDTGKRIAVLKTAAVIACLLIQFAAGVHGATVSGTVFWDEDANGVRGEAEPGVEAMRLYALHRTAVTDSDGHYSLSADEPIVTVSISFPSGTWPTAGWFRRVEQEQATGVDFGLRREECKLPFVFVHLTDPHWTTPQAFKQVADECEALPLKPRFYICTGDMRSGDPSVRDTSELRRTFGTIGAAFRDFPAPLFMVPGNHDTVGYGGAARKVIRPEDTRHPLFGNRCWERYVCPGHWSFSCGGVHFVGMEFANYVGGKWNPLCAETKQWLQEDVAASPEGEHTVFFSHDPGMGGLVAELDMTLGLFGHTHNRGRHYCVGSEVPEFGDSVLASGIAQPSAPGDRPHWCQDGSPPGYRVLVVQDDQLNSFYRPFGQPHAIMVNEPRRFVTVEAPERLNVRGQCFDPAGEIESISVALGGYEGTVDIERRLLWAEFSTSIDTAELEDGFHELKVTALSPGNRFTLAEPYLVRTGRQAAFAASGPATLRGHVSRLKQPCTVLVNGQRAGVLQPEGEGESFELEVASEVLLRLNRVSLAPMGGARPRLSNISMCYDDREYVDQHRIFHWFYDPVLGRRSGEQLFFDLEMPGPPARWHMQQHSR